MKPEVFKILMSEDWGKVGKRLLGFALWRASHYNWESGNSQVLAEGMTPEDIVQDVITKTLTGERAWNPDLGPLEPWLRDQVKSIIDALVKSAAHRREAKNLEDPDRDERALDSVAHKENVIFSFAVKKPPNPEDELIEKERQRMMAEKSSELFAAVSGDKELEEVLETIMNGCEPKPQAIAEELGASVENINNRIKRLRRRALKLERDEL